MLRIRYQRSKCIGCAYCADIAPERWTMSPKDGKATLAGGKKKGAFFLAEVPADQHEENLRAAESCPVGIIQVEWV